MTPTQTVTFLLPASEAPRVIAAIRQNFSNALIGRKPYEADSVLLAVTLYADEAERMLETPATPPPGGSLGELLDAIRRQAR